MPFVCNHFLDLNVSLSFPFLNLHSACSFFLKNKWNTIMCCLYIDARQTLSLTHFRLSAHEWKLDFWCKYMNTISTEHYWLSVDKHRQQIPHRKTNQNAIVIFILYLSLFASKMISFNSSFVYIIWRTLHIQRNTKFK